MKIKEEDKGLDYWKANAEEDYMTTPISVLRYITELENKVNNVVLDDVMFEPCHLFSECKNKLKDQYCDEHMAGSMYCFKG